MKYLRIILLFIFAIPVIAFSQERGIKIVAIDEATKEWQEISLYNKTHAVIIGIDQYPQLSTEQQLTYAVSDAKAVELMLKGKFVFNKIYALYNEEATKSNIEDVLLNKLSKISKDDAVFIFFAGHGGQEKTDYGDIGYIVPYDGDFTDMRKVISMSTIRDDISKRIKAKHVFFVMDACYSGILVTTRGTESTLTKRDYSYLKQIAKESVRQVLTAGDANQQVLDGGPNGHSVFTGRFLEILDSAEDFITAEEISSKVKEMVFSDANARGHIQTPKSGTLFGLGDFIFMPSLTKKQGNIKQQVSDLEKELKRIEELDKLAQEQENQSEKRKLERQRKVAESQLQAKKLEEQRLEKERIVKERQEQERKQELAEQKQKQEEETLRLESLKEEVEGKRKTYKSSMILSLDQSLEELQSLDKQIKEIKSSYIEELKKRIMNIAESYSNNYSFSTLVKDEFETETEYQERLKTQAGDLKSSNQQEFTNAMETIKTAFDEQIATLLLQVNEISSNTYTIYGHDALKIKLGKYIAETESFMITVASNNIEQEIFPQTSKIISDLKPNQFIANGGLKIPRAEARNFKQNFLNGFVTAELSIQPISHSMTYITGAVIVDESNDKRYDLFKSEYVFMGNKLVYDTVNDIAWLTSYPKKLNWYGVKQYAANHDYKGVGDWEVSSLNQIKNLRGKQEFNFEKKRFYTSTQDRNRGHFWYGPSENYTFSRDSDYNYFLLYTFMQNRINEINIFETRFFELNQNLVFDAKNKLIWFKKSINEKKYNYRSALEFVENLTFQNLKGWRLPSLKEFKDLYDNSIPGFCSFFDFEKKRFYTSTQDKNRGHFWYGPSENYTFSRDSDHNYVIGVM